MGRDLRFWHRPPKGAAPRHASREPASCQRRPREFPRPLAPPHGRRLSDFSDWCCADLSVSNSSRCFLSSFSLCILPHIKISLK